MEREREKERAMSVLAFGEAIVASFKIPELKTDKILPFNLPYESTDLERVAMRVTGCLSSVILIV